MNNCEAVAILDHLIKSGRKDTPEELKRNEDLAIAKAISALWPAASIEEDFEKNADFFKNCCIKGEEDYLSRYRKNPGDSIPER